MEGRNSGKKGTGLAKDLYEWHTDLDNFLGIDCKQVVQEVEEGKRGQTGTIVIK